VSDLDKAITKPTAPMSVTERLLAEAVRELRVANELRMSHLRELERIRERLDRMP
jgi:hypothetical protein